jgi:predicted dehydrogenase
MYPPAKRGTHVSKKVKWGILSTAKIGREQVIPALKNGDLTDVVAIASRDASRAQDAAAEFGIPKAYASYEALLADPEIDAVSPLRRWPRASMSCARSRSR